MSPRSWRRWCTWRRWEKCASNLVSAPLVLVLLDPRPLFRDNRARRHAEQEVSLASVKDDEVLRFVKKRPGTVRIDRVAPRLEMIGPVFNFTVAASGRANQVDRPFSVLDVDANLGDRATHDIVHARPAEGILPFEAGNATNLILGMNVGNGPWNARKTRKEQETCREKKILSELAHRSE